ncbi:unnamed protein product [Bemisia tabaci]|uniref:Uncharacterized protein n=1 Tax=Bemisia tabaci TaxID=7038 RepID=A0A9P0F797_BEMTA|nr:unnamed protein product [Bemisia tabaci]
MDAPATLSSMLVIDDFLVLRPLQWGILGDNTTANLRADLVRMTNAARVGLYTYKGCSEYPARVNSDSSYVIVPYGIQVLNFVAQFFQMADFQPDYKAADYSQGLEEQFANLSLGYATHTYDAQLHIFEPCTVWTFDWGDNEVRAPVMTAPNEMTIPRAKTIDSWGPALTLPGVGMKLARSQITFLTGLSTARIKGIKDRLARDKANSSNASATESSVLPPAGGASPAGDDGLPAGNA